MVWDLFLIVLLVALNGFFVAAEFAIVKVRYAQVEAKASEGSFVAKSARAILDRLDAYLSATQLGITLASLALGWVGEPVVEKVLVNLFEAFSLPFDDRLAHSIALPVGFLFITVLHLIFGEVVPKTVAIMFPQRVTYFTAIPLTAFTILFQPLVWFCNIASRSVLAPFGIKLGEGEETHSETELRLLLAQSARSEDVGSIRKTEHDLIEKVFHFDNRVVRQIMVPRTQMVSVAIDSSSDEIFDMIVREGYSRMPVFSDSRDNIVGVVHSKDLLRVLRDHNPAVVRDLMRPAFFVPETKKIGEVLAEFQQRRIHLAIVVDEFGVTSGMVTLEDIVEELVGEIQDEYDEEAPVVEQKSQTAFLVNAHAPIIDVNRHLPVPLPEGNTYSTVAGLLNVIFSYIPEVGNTKRFGGYEFTVVKRSKRSVDTALLERLPEPDSQDDDDEGDDEPDMA